MVAQITEALSGVGTWLVNLFNQLVALFWVEGTGDVEGHLTFVGTIAIIGVGIGLALLLFRTIRSFMHLKG